MKLLRNTWIFCCLLAAFPVLAQEPELTAVQTAEKGVNALLQTVEESRALFASNPEQYYQAIEQVLDSFVDFEAVATVVMSRYASAASDAQRSRFADILQSTLTRFYGASLVNYGNQQLTFLPPRESSDDPRADTVVGMELKGDGTNPFRLQYQMFLNDNNEWKLKNLSLGGINLGRQYYSQFSALMNRYDNDIDQVLDNWQ